MPQLPERNRSLEKSALSAFEEVGRSLQRAHESLGISQVEKSLQAFAQTQSKMREAMAPFEAAAKRLKEFTNEVTKPSSFSLDRTFFLPPPAPRYPSAKEIAIEMVNINSENKKTAKDHDGKTIPIPDQGLWENVRLDLQDNRSITIFYNTERIGTFDYEDLELTRKSQGRVIPDRQAHFLQKLAFAFVSGGKFKPTVESMAQELHISNVDCYQVKSILTKKLKKTFGLTANPFYPYDRTEGYSPRFKLRPQPLLRGDGKVHASGGKFFEETFESDEE